MTFFMFCQSQLFLTYAAVIMGSVNLNRSRYYGMYLVSIPGIKDCLQLSGYSHVRIKLSLRIYKEFFPNKSKHSRNSSLNNESCLPSEISSVQTREPTLVRVTRAHCPLNYRHWKARMTCQSRRWPPEFSHGRWQHKFVYLINLISVKHDKAIQYFSYYVREK